MMSQRWKKAGGILAMISAAPMASYLFADGLPLNSPQTGQSIDAARVEVKLNERWIRIPGSETVVRLWDEKSADGRLVPHYAISLDGRSFATSRATSYDILLSAASFDPLRHSPEPLPGLTAGEGNEIRIVQFHTQPLEAYRTELNRLGASIHTFLSNHAFVVRMDDDTRDAVAKLPFVRWVGEFHPAYKLHQPVLDQLMADDYGHLVAGAPHDEAEPANVLAANGSGQGAEVATTYNIVVFERGPAQKTIVADAIRAMGGRVDNLIPQGFRMVATLTPSQLAAVLDMNEVGWVDLWSPPEPDMNVARDIGGANYLENETGFSGEGVRGEVMDSGIRPSHVDFQNPPLIWHRQAGLDSHGHSTYGITFGTGTGNSTGRGMLPDAEAKFFALWSPPNRYTHTAELVDPNGSYRGVFQTNSWGSGRTRSYTSESQEMDDIIFEHDVVITQSQSNAGNQDSRPQAWAKNIVSVGGVYHQNTLSKADDRWNFGGSTGPASDGRIKPELTHFYDNIFTTYYTSDTAYTSGFGGTSGATPIVAGHFGLAFQMWHEGVFPGFGGGPSVFDDRPHAATAKALIINTSEQYEFTGVNHDQARTHQGWGMPDVGFLYDARNDMLIINESEVLTNLQSASYNVTVDGTYPEFRATLVYNDPAGVPFSNRHRINDLSLKVTSPSGTVYWGNNGLRDGNYSTPGGNANIVDTVENVLVEGPELGEWSVEVIASEVVEDSHLETPATDVDFALVVSGGVGEPGMILQVPDLVGGQPATFTTQNATPNETVYFIYSLTGEGSTFVPALNVTLDLARPNLGGSAVADANGTATFDTNLPNRHGVLIWLQAAEVGETSNVVFTQIN